MIYDMITMTWLQKMELNFASGISVLLTEYKWVSTLAIKMISISYWGIDLALSKGPKLCYADNANDKI